jgi:hypothetical protein
VAIIPPLSQVTADSEYGALNRATHKSFCRPLYINDTSVTGSHGLGKLNFFVGHIGLSIIPHNILLTMKIEIADHLTLIDIDI